MLIPYTVEARTLPDKYVQFAIKDRPYQETIVELFKLTPLKVAFTKEVQVDKTVSITVEKVRWSVLLLAVLDSYDMKYRFTSDDTVEIFR